MENEELKLNTPLKIEEIEFRVQSVNKGGYATILAYKDARVDMQRLDDVVGYLNWKREHTKDNHNCIVSIWDKEKKEWVSKEDTGTESNTEKEKGLASDSFKRACFNWGIGRELYSYPLIQVKLNDTEFDSTTGKTKFAFKLKEWVWKSEFDEKDDLISLSCVDSNNRERFKWHKYQLVAKVEPNKMPKEEPKTAKPVLSDKQYQQALSKDKETIKKVLETYDMTDRKRECLTDMLK